jgi:16S rRNA (guanine(966)-N(2))-methyltransferase RsmD
MRIIAGTAKGRTLATPKNAKTIRPTSDRVRESIFNVLGQWCEGEVVLDLFSGTGALGLEALSRGATRAVLVDASREGSELSRKNAETLGFGAQVQVLAQPADRAIATLGKSGEKFTLVFMDPPYAQRAIEDLLEALAAAGVLAEGARIVAEHGKKEDVAEQVGTLTRNFHRVFGDTQVSIFG